MDTYPSEKLIKLYKLLGLTELEIKVMKSLSSMAKSRTVIAKHTNISLGSLLYMLNSLEKRGFVIKVPGFTSKRTVWKSNIHKIMRELRFLTTPLDMPR